MSKPKSPISGMAGGSEHNGSSKKKDSTKTDSKEYFVRKFSSGIPLAEQIMIGGRSYFLQITAGGKPKLLPFIDLSKDKGMILVPNHTVGSASPIIEFEYNDLQEIEYFIDRASRMKLDDLYFLVKSIFKEVVATDEPELIILLTTDTIMTFFQDLFVTTHYLVLTGPPGWGKGAILTTLKILGYRVVLAGDMSGANLLDLLGPIEKCQVTLCEDEFDNIHDDPVKERIYKMGYEDIGSVTRTVDPSSSDRRLLYYIPYCMKFFASEKGLDDKELGGFNDRTFRSDVKKGKPRFLIKQIKRQMELSPDKQLPKYRTIISRINFLRKVMLVYRLLHHNDTIDEVPLNIADRALELCGPAIMLFNSEHLASPKRKALNEEILPTLSYYLRKKGKLDEKAIELVIHDVLIDLFNQIDKEEANPGTSTIIDKDDLESCIQGNTLTNYVVSCDVLCKWVMKDVEGNLITQRTFESAEYGRMTFDSILSSCRSIYKAQSDRINKGKNKKARALLFVKDEVIDAGKQFEVISEIKILTEEDEQDKTQEEDSEDKTKWEEWTNGSNQCTRVRSFTQKGGIMHIDNNQNSEVDDSQKQPDDNEKTTILEKNTNDITKEHKTDKCTDIRVTPCNEEKRVHAYTDNSDDCDLRNQEGADRFKAEVDRLSKNKVADDMAEANSSGNGLMENV